MVKKILSIITLIVLCFRVTFGCTLIPSNFNEKFSFTIVLDAGHGGIDGGVIGVNSKVKESELNLLTVKELKTVFENAGFNVILTRKDENGLYGDTTSGFKLRDLNKRKEIVNSSNADVLISIHMNKYQDKRRRGAQVFYKQNDKTSNFLAEKIQNRLNLMKESSRISNSLKGDYYILNTSKIPAVIVECGFLSNEKDEELLLSESYRKKLAIEIFNGVNDYLTVKYSSYENL